MGKKILYYVPSVVVPVVINLIIIVLCGIYLPPAEYGIMSIYTTTITLLYSLGLAFIQNSALRFFTDDRCRDKSVYFTTFVISNLLMSLLLTLIVIVIRLFIPALNVALVSISVLANGLYMLCVNIDRLEDKHITYTFERCIAALIDFALFCIFIFVFRHYTFITPVISLYGSYLLVAIIKLGQNARYFKISKFSKQIFIDSYKFGLPLIGVAVVGSLIANSDQYMLLYYLDEASVGLYSLGYKISDYSVTRFTSLLLIVATPAIIKYYDQKQFEKSSRTIISTVESIIWVWFALMSLVLMYSSELIKYVFPNYAGADTVMQVVIVAALFHCISELYCKPFELVKKTKELMTYTFIAGAINIIYNLVFIPIQGVIAAAISSVIAYVVLDLLLFIKGKKYMDLTPELSLSIKMLITAAITCLFAFLMKITIGCNSLFSFILQVIICGIIYLSISYFTGQITQVFQIGRRK